MTLGQATHHNNLQRTCKMVTSPNYMFLTIYNERPRKDVQINNRSCVTAVKSKGCTLLISDGFDQLIMMNKCMNKRMLMILETDHNGHFSNVSKKH